MILYSLNVCLFSPEPKWDTVDAMEWSGVWRWSVENTYMHDRCLLTNLYQTVIFLLCWRCCRIWAPNFRAASSWRLGYQSRDTGSKGSTKDWCGQIWWAHETEWRKMHMYCLMWLCPLFYSLAQVWGHNQTAFIYWTWWEQAVRSHDMCQVSDLQIQNWESC